MSKKLTKRLSKFLPAMRGHMKLKPSHKSFSIPKDLRKKKQCSTIQRRDELVAQIYHDSETSSDADHCWTTDGETIGFSNDLGDFSSREEYPPIEVARSAGACFSTISMDTLVAKQSIVLNSSFSDPKESFSFDPIAFSTPIKHSELSLSSKVDSEYFKEHSPVASSTPKKKRRNNEDNTEILNFITYTLFEESTIKDISFTPLPGREIKEDSEFDIEELLHENSSLLSITIPDLSEILKCEENESVKTPSISHSLNILEINTEVNVPKPSVLGCATENTNGSDVSVKEPVYKCISDSKIEKMKLTKKNKEFQNISVCPLTIPPKDFKKLTTKIKKGSKEFLPVCAPILKNRDCQKLLIKPTALRTRSAPDRLQKKGLMNVSVCCLGAIECVLPTLNMAVPSVSVKNASKTLNQKLRPG